MADFRPLLAILLFASVLISSRAEDAEDVFSELFSSPLLMSGQYPFIFIRRFRDQVIGNVTSELDHFGATLTVSEDDKNSQLDRLTICLRAQLNYELPSCLFDVAGIQFFYAQPREDKIHRFGYLRFKNHDDRTAVFRPKSFKVGEWNNICLTIDLGTHESKQGHDTHNCRRICIKVFHL